jgi:hypothetical protein
VPRGGCPAGLLLIGPGCAVLMNLVGNAVKSPITVASKPRGLAETGGPQPHHAADFGGGHGVGFRRQADSIFEPFVQAGANWKWRRGDPPS